MSRKVLMSFLFPKQPGFPPSPKCQTLLRSAVEIVCLWKCQVVWETQLPGTTDEVIGVYGYFKLITEKVNL